MVLPTPVSVPVMKKPSMFVLGVYSKRTNLIELIFDGFLGVLEAFIFYEKKIHFMNIFNYSFINTLANSNSSAIAG